jgi:hypothetical protein
VNQLSIGASLVLGCAIASTIGACSATDNTHGGSGNATSAGGIGTSSGGAASGGVLTGSGGTTSAGGQGVGNTGNFINVGAGTSSGGADGSGGVSTDCGEVQKPEEVIQYSPVALFIMQDRSGSMVTGFPPPASADGWNNSLAAVTAFVNDPSSAGISVGLGSFPPMTGNTDCAAGSDCGMPIVPIAALPGNAPPMISGMQTATPNNPVALTPTECGLRGMVSQCLAFTGANKMPCVGVLVTDGTPTQCDGNDTTLTGIVSTAAGQGMKTFVIGLPGSDLNRLNMLAQAGGTNAAIDVSGGVGAFTAALNAIRDKVSIGTKLECTWKIPPPPQGQIFNPQKVNVVFTPKGAAPVDFGYVKLADCATATNAWYFNDDNTTNPTQILACPTTCDMLKGSSGAEVDVTFGCDTKPGRVQ